MDEEITEEMFDGSDEEDTDDIELENFYDSRIVVDKVFEALYPVLRSMRVIFLKDGLMKIADQMAEEQQFTDTQLRQFIVRVVDIIVSSLRLPENYKAYLIDALLSLDFNPPSPQ